MIPTDPLYKEGLVETYSGIKYDHNKLQYELIPPEFLEGLASVLTFGANKYGARNWEKGLNFLRLVGALLRHIIAWCKREDNDRESGLNHLLHACCCLMFLYTLQCRGMKQLDDRWGDNNV